MIGHLRFDCQSPRAWSKEIGAGRSENFPIFNFHFLIDGCPVEQSIESFIRYLAVERGLSDNYQLSTQRSLTDFARWCAGTRKIEAFKAVTLPTLSEYLADKKRAGLSAAPITQIVVGVKIFFRFLANRGKIKSDPTEALSLPRIERYLPETLNEMQVEKLLNSIDRKAPHGLRDRARMELLSARWRTRAWKIFIRRKERSASSAKETRHGSCRSAAKRAKRWRFICRPNARS